MSMTTTQKDESDGQSVPALRFGEYRDAPAWEVRTLGEVLDYERPEKYIVKSENYLSDGIAVLTANKSFILGYTDEEEGIYVDIPVIIFDDFTTDKKYVDFLFKVKSSAMKILKEKKGNDLRFVYEFLSMVKFDASTHKRYYISQYSKISIPLPTLPEQHKIGQFLASVDTLIQQSTTQLDHLKQYKKGLLQQLFPRDGENVPALRFAGFDDEWQVVRLGDVCTLGRGRVISQKDLVKTGLYPVYSSQTSNNGIFGYLETFDFNGEYITWTTDGAYAGTVFFRNGKFNCTNVCGTLKLKNENNDTHFVAIALSKETFQYVNKNGNPKLMNNIVEKIPISLPTLPEQRKIGQFLASFDTLIQQGTTQLDHLKNYKKGLLQQLFP